MLFTGSESGETKQIEETGAEVLGGIAGARRVVTGNWIYYIAVKLGNLYLALGISEGVTLVGSGYCFTVPIQQS